MTIILQPDNDAIRSTYYLSSVLGRKVMIKSNSEKIIRQLHNMMGLLKKSMSWKADNKKAVN